jgi:hypothetical protein
MFMHVLKLRAEDAPLSKNIMNEGMCAYMYVHIYMYEGFETLQSVTAEHLCLLQNTVNDGNMYMYVCLCMC